MMKTAKTTTARQQNHGLRKVCECPRRQWAKCSHPWHVNIQWKGQSLRKSLDRLTGERITSKTEAEAAFDRLKVRLRETGSLDTAMVPSSALTLEDVLNRYQRDYLSRRPSAANTALQIASITRTLVPHSTGARPFGAWPVGDVTSSELWAYKTAREVKTVVLAKDGSPTKRAVGGVVTANRDIQLLRRAFNWALAAMPGDVTSSPFAAGKPPKGLVGAEVARSRRLQGDEGDRLLAACGVALRPLVVAALETGCRLGELLGLQWQDVHLQPERPYLHLAGARTKTRKSRNVPISVRLRPILEMRRTDADGEAHAADAYVFGYQATGQPVTTIKTAWRLTLKRAKIVELHFHDLRREAASRWLDAGIRLSAVSKLLGHTTTEQTATYLACVLNAEHDAIAAFDDYRSRLQDSASGVSGGVANGAQESTIGDSGTQESSADRVIH